jgi:hypothetical protein
MPTLWVSRRPSMSHEDAAGFLSAAAARREGLQRMAQAQN